MTKLSCASFSNLKLTALYSNYVQNKPDIMASEDCNNLQYKIYIEFNRTSPGVWLNVRFINGIIETEINHSVEAKKEVQIFQRD